MRYKGIMPLRCKKEKLPLPPVGKAKGELFIVGNFG